MSIAVSSTADIGAGLSLIVFTVPVNAMFTGNIRVTNRTTTDIKVRVAICKTDVPSNDEFIEYDATIPANDVLEDTALVLKAGERFYVSTNTPGVSVRVHGFQETT